jgi:hypothetical protein
MHRKGYEEGKNSVEESVTSGVVRANKLKSDSMGGGGVNLRSKSHRTDMNK